MRKVIVIFLFFSFQIFCEFTLPSTGAREQGLGNAFIGLSDSLYAIVFNPAGLSSITSYEVSFSYTTSNHNYDFLGITLPQRLKGNCGIGILSREDKALYFSYGRNLKIKNKALQGGTSIKLFKSKNDKKGLGLDLGILYPLKDNLKVGFVLGNILRSDFGYGFGLSAKFKNFLFVGDIKERKTSSLHFGIEKEMKGFFVRSGFGEKSLSLGASSSFSGILVSLSIFPLCLSVEFGY